MFQISLLFLQIINIMSAMKELLKNVGKTASVYLTLPMKLMKDTTMMQYIPPQTRKAQILFWSELLIIGECFKKYNVTDTFSLFPIYIIEQEY